MSPVGFEPKISAGATYKYIYIYTKILNYITNAPTWFRASALPSGSFVTAFVKVIK